MRRGDILRQLLRLAVNSGIVVSDCRVLEAIEALFLFEYEPVSGFQLALDGRQSAPNLRLAPRAFFAALLLQRLQIVLDHGENVTFFFLRNSLRPQENDERLHLLVEFAHLKAERVVDSTGGRRSGSLQLVGVRQSFDS